MFSTNLRITVWLTTQRGISQRGRVTAVLTIPLPALFPGSPPISDVKLLQGELAEAWREGTDYATVAMRFSLNDETLDRDSGRVLQGGPDEATEIWTFMRVRSGHWLVSAIQQS